MSLIEEVVAPLDAYATAKPDEPTFTLQGGDPLAASIVRIWAYCARIRAGLLSLSKITGDEVLGKALIAAQQYSVAHDDQEVRNLKIRATAAEEVSWTMDAYLRGDGGTQLPTEAQDTHLTELERIDLHDLKVRVAQRLSNFRCELIEMRDGLIKAGFQDYLGDFLNAENHLNEANKIVEPRRIRTPQ
jgi:hypothetical protein